MTMRRHFEPVFSSVLFLIFYLISGVILSFLFKNSIAGAIAADGLIAACGVYYCRFLRKDVRADIHVSSRTLFLTFLSLFGVWCASQLFSLCFVYKYFGSPALDDMAGVVRNNVWLYLILTVVAAPVAEEILFRKVLFANLCRTGIPVWLSCFLSAAVFALYHGTLVHLPLGIAVGLFFACVYMRTGRIWICVACHVLYNLLSVIYSVYMLPEGMRTPEFSVLAYAVMMALLIRAVVKGPVVAECTVSLDTSCMGCAERSDEHA